MCKRQNCVIERLPNWPLEDPQTNLLAILTQGITIPSDDLGKLDISEHRDTAMNSSTSVTL